MCTREKAEATVELLSWRLCPRGEVDSSGIGGGGGGTKVDCPGEEELVEVGLIMRKILRKPDWRAVGGSGGAGKFVDVLALGVGISLDS